MIRTRSWPLLLLVAAACGGSPPPAAAPTADATAPGIVVRGEPPIYALLGHRQQLNLSSEQVVALDSIAQAMQAANAALSPRLPNPGAAPARGARVEVDTAAIRELRENRRRAADSVQQVLTEEQQARVCTIFRNHQAELQRGRNAAPQAGRQAQRVRQTGQAPAVARGSPWPWCDERA